MRFRSFGTEGKQEGRRQVVSPCRGVTSRSWGLIACLVASTYAFAQSAIVNPLLELPASQIAEAYGAERTYTITRNGKPVGEHTMRFTTTADETVVAVASSITVTILRVPVYRLKYESREVWVENTLKSVTATTTENGEVNTVTLNNGEATEPTTRFASNHWHPGVLTGDTVFNTLTGETSNIEVTEVGLEQVDTPFGTTDAFHYEYNDDIRANVWYDEQGLWLKMVFLAEDGSAIQYLRNQ